MARPKIKPEVSTENSAKAERRWNVIVRNDPVNFMGYVVVAFVNVLRIPHDAAKQLMRLIHEEGRATVWTGGRERAEMLALELQQWHLDARLEPDA
ncbi:MAG: ATP-dependent Clp protease adaptor ClpS [Opitutales bacterium]